MNREMEPQHEFQSCFHIEKPTLEEMEPQHEFQSCFHIEKPTLEELNSMRNTKISHFTPPSQEDFGIFRLSGKVLEKYNSEDDDDATKDIIETPEMTEEAEFAILELFENVENKEDKLKIITEKNGGVTILFGDWKLVIYPTGNRFALKNLEDGGDVRFFREEEKIILKEILNKLFGAKTTYDAEKDLAAPITIKLKKGFDKKGLKEFVNQVDIFLRSRKGLPTKLSIKTDEWKNNSTNFMMIPGAKKMFARYCDAGLLACLVSNGFHQAAKELYCISYAKGKIKGDGVEFKKCSVEDFSKKLELSMENYKPSSENPEEF